jgi:hypothetical protein
MNEMPKAVITPMSTAGKMKRAKAHRRQGRRGRGSKQEDTIMMTANDVNNSVKLPTRQRRSDKSNSKALIRKMKKQQSIANTEQKKRKMKASSRVNKKRQEKVAGAKSGGILPEERA